MKPTNFPRRMNAKRTVALSNLEAQLKNLNPNGGKTPEEVKAKKSYVEGQIKILKTRITA